MSSKKLTVSVGEVDSVPYLGMPECRSCPQRETEIHESRIWANDEIADYSIHLQCAKLPECKRIREKWLNAMAKQIVDGSSDMTPTGLCHAGLQEERAHGD